MTRKKAASSRPKCNYTDLYYPVQLSRNEADDILGVLARHARALRAMIPAEDKAPRQVKEAEELRDAFARRLVANMPRDITSFVIGAGEHLPRKQQRVRVANIMGRTLRDHYIGYHVLLRGNVWLVMAVVEQEGYFNVRLEGPISA